MTALAIIGLVPQPSGRISGGKVLLRGHDLLKFSKKVMQDVRGNEISMIFQEPMTSLNPVFTIGNQIAETVRKHQGLTRRESLNRAVEMVRAVGIPAPERRVREYPHQISGGMRQRVMIAMALACQPDLLIADEPTTALDVTVQAQIFDLLHDLQERTGAAIILITHNMGVIAEVAKRVIVMYAGYKVEEGPVQEIITNPRHPYTRGLLRCIPHLHIDPGPDREELMEIPGIVPDPSQLGVDCPFRPRCTYSMEQCEERMPPTIEVGQGHCVACWVGEETL
jgi:peptide/nickel transport system ATP-binding protein